MASPPTPLSLYTYIVFKSSLYLNLKSGLSGMQLFSMACFKKKKYAFVIGFTYHIAG